MKKLALVLIVLFSLSYQSFAYDKKSCKMPWFENLSNAVVVLKVNGSGYGFVTDPNGNQVKRTGVFNQCGMGITTRGLNGETYIITAAHVVEATTVDIQLTKNERTPMPLVELISIKILIGDPNNFYGFCPAKIVFKSQSTDVAVLKVEKGWMSGEPISVPCGRSYGYNSNKSTGTPTRFGLEKDDSIAVLVMKRGELELGNWYEVRYGRVVSLEPIGWKNNLVLGVAEFDFTTDIRVYSGDSGAPAFVFNNGKPIFIGIVRAMNLNRETGACYSYIARLDYITDILSILK